MRRQLSLQILGQSIRILHRIKFNQTRCIGNMVRAHGEDFGADVGEVVVHNWFARNMCVIYIEFVFLLFMSGKLLFVSTN